MFDLGKIIFCLLLFEEWAFYWCSNLSSVTIPTSVTSIEVNAFGNCNSLKTIHYLGSRKEWGDISKYNSEFYSLNITYQTEETTGTFALLFLFVFPVIVLVIIAVVKNKHKTERIETTYQPQPDQPIQASQQVYQPMQTDQKQSYSSDSTPMSDYKTNAEVLRIFKQLYDDGIITEEEFNKKKEALLK